MCFSHSLVRRKIRKAKRTQEIPLTYTSITNTLSTTSHIWNHRNLSTYLISNLGSTSLPLLNKTCANRAFGATNSRASDRVRVLFEHRVVLVEPTCRNRTKTPRSSSSTISVIDTQSNRLSPQRYPVSSNHKTLLRQISIIRLRPSPVEKLIRPLRPFIRISDSLMLLSTLT